MRELGEETAACPPRLAARAGQTQWDDHARVCLCAEDAGEVMQFYTREVLLPPHALIRAGR